MTNYHYNELNAHDVADKIIAAEVAYRDTDYDALSFEEKCRYAMDYTPIVHPILAPDPSRRKSLLEALRPALLSRADKEDGFALYVLGSLNADLSSPATDAERRFLERAVKAGYAPAAIALVDRFFGDLKDQKLCRQALHDYLIPALNRLTEEGSQDEATIYAIKSLLSRYETTATARMLFCGMSRELATKLVCNGSYVGLAKLCNARAVSDGLLDITPSEEEISFWVTVDYLVHAKLYELGAYHLGDTLGRKLINERGCAYDGERIQAIYTDLISHRAYDRERLLTVLGLPHGATPEALSAAERACRRQIKEGNPTDYWHLILLLLLSGEREKLSAVCGEACAAHRAADLAKAYQVLRQV